MALHCWHTQEREMRSASSIKDCVSQKIPVPQNKPFQSLCIPTSWGNYSNFHEHRLLLPDTSGIIHIACKLLFLAHLVHIMSESFIFVFIILLCINIPKLCIWLLLTDIWIICRLELLWINLPSMSFYGISLWVEFLVLWVYIYL